MTAGASKIKRRLAWFSAWETKTGPDSALIENAPSVPVFVMGALGRWEGSGATPGVIRLRRRTFSRGNMGPRAGRAWQ